MKILKTNYDVNDFSKLHNFFHCFGWSLLESNGRDNQISHRLETMERSALDIFSSPLVNGQSHETEGILLSQPNSTQHNSSWSDNVIGLSPPTPSLHPPSFG